MSGAQLLALGLLLLAGFLIGGVISFGRERRWIPAGILALLAVVAAVAAVLRLV
ncbi:hypothetical protein [Actinomycetospora sp. CA-084318]|uniref:hypothetical protein n=1 Tax=Actinomycetospora sp. CA-084318 TaxID=3239892 RepID=UPI003D970564